MGANLDITDKLQNYINKFGLKLDLGREANGGLDDGLSVTENWMDDFADEVDDDYSDSDEDDTGKGAWQLTSPLSQKKHLHALMKRKSSSGNMTPQSPSLAKLKTLLQMLSIAILLTGESGNKLINFQDYNAQTIGIILLWLSAFLTLYTGYDYVRKGIDHAINEDKKN